VGGKPKDPLKAAALGAFSTSIAQVFTTPLDVGRNRIMSSRAKGQVPASGESGGNIVSVCNVAAPLLPAPNDDDDDDDDDDALTPSF
jgi:hypothetical protein